MRGKTRKMINKVKSIQDKIYDIKVNEDGSVEHKLLLASNKTPRKFKDLDTFNTWAKKHLRERKEDLKTKITPH